MSLTQQQVEERLSSAGNDTNNIAGIIASATGKTEEEIHIDLRQGRTLDPEEAVAYGLVHEIKKICIHQALKLFEWPSVKVRHRDGAQLKTPTGRRHHREAVVDVERPRTHGEGHFSSNGVEEERS